MGHGIYDQSGFLYASFRIIQEATLLREIRNNWHKSKAAVLVETAFERCPMPYILPVGRGKFANTLVETLWSEDPSSFDGTKSSRPHPIAIAAAALAQGVIDNRFSRVIHHTCLAALDATIGQIRDNRNVYAFSGSDLIFIAIAEDQLAAEIEELTDRASAAAEPASSDQGARKPPTDEELEHRMAELDKKLNILKR